MGCGGFSFWADEGVRPCMILFGGGFLGGGVGFGSGIAVIVRDGFIPLSGEFFRSFVTAVRGGWPPVAVCAKGGRATRLNSRQCEVAGEAFSTSRLICKSRSPYRSCSSLSFIFSVDGSVIPVMRTLQDNAKIVLPSASEKVRVGR